jgi:hypothetical protein
MALKKTIVLKDNFGDNKTFVDAYIRVSSVNGGKNQMGIFVDTLKSDKSAIVKQDQFGFTPSLEGKNFIAQAYEHLKTMPEYADAVDC